MAEALTDKSIFPFGKHARDKRKMKHVPVRYYHWVWHHCEPSPDVDRVKEYIRTSAEALKSEDEDLIWTM
jgi:hypothetical protein